MFKSLRGWMDAWDTQIGDLTKQFATMGVASGCRRQPNPHFLDEDDKCTIKEARLQQEVMLNKRNQLCPALTIVSKLKIYLPNPSQVLEEDKSIKDNFSVDWVSPPIYDIYWMRLVFRLTENILLMRVTYIICLTKAQRVKYLRWVLKKLVFLISLGLTI